MSLYEYFKQKIVPPLFLVVFTASVQFLALFGRGETITWEAILSGLSGNLVAWRIVAVLFTWAYFWLIVARKETKGDPAPDGYIPKYKVSSLILEDNLFLHVFTIIAKLLRHSWIVLFIFYSFIIQRISVNALCFLFSHNLIKFS